MIIRGKSAARLAGVAFILAGVVAIPLGVMAAHAASGLSVTASVSPDPMVVGGDAVYTVTVTNNDTQTADNVTVTDALDPNVTLGTLPTGCTAGGQTVTCGGTGTTLAPGASLTYTIPVSVDPGISDGTNIINEASVSSSNVAGDSYRLISQAYVETDVEITKTGPASVNPDGSITYTITVTNHGPSDAVNVFVHDPTDGNLTTITDLPPQCPPSGLTVSCDLGTMAPGEAVTFTFTSSVNPDVPEGTVINNCATVYTGTRETNTENNESCVDTIVGPTGTADLGIAKTGPATVSPGGTITYTVTVTDHGTAAADNVVISDPLLDDVTPVEPLPAGCVITDRILTCDVGTLAAGETKTYTFSVAVPDDEAAGTQIDNCASVGVEGEGTDGYSCTQTEVQTSVPTPTETETVTPVPTALPTATTTPTPSPTCTCAPPSWPPRLQTPSMTGGPLEPLPLLEGLGAVLGLGLL